MKFPTSDCFVLLAFSSIVIGCQPRSFHQEGAAIQEFAPVSRVDLREVNMSLSRVAGWNANPANQAISPRFVWQRLQRPAVLPDFPADPAGAKEGLDVRLGKLNPQQFEFMLKTYRGSPRPMADANHDYRLVEFLPPLVQALEGNVFIFQSERVPALNRGRSGAPGAPDGPVDEAVTASANCWGTVYEVSRLRSFDPRRAVVPQEFYVFYTDRGQAETALRSDTFSRSLGRGAIQQLENAMPFEQSILNKEPGDVLLVTTELTLGNGKKVRVVEHAAIYIDEGLYFEKANGGADDPYQLSTLTEVVRPYVTRRPTDLEYRRFDGLELPHPTSLFGDPAKVRPDDPRYAKPIPPELAERIKLSSEFFLEDGQRYYTWSAFFPVKLVDQGGRFLLHGSAMQKETFQFDPTQPRLIIW